MVRFFTPRATRFVLVPVVALFLGCAAHADVVLRFNTNQVNQLNVTAEANDVFLFRTLGEDPFIVLEPFDAADAGPDDRVLAFEYFCPDGINELEVFYGPPIRAGQSLSGGALGKAETWQPFAVDLNEASSGQWTQKLNLLRLDLGRRAGVELRIRDLRLRPPNPAEMTSAAERERVREQKLEAARIVTDYLATEMPVRLESVAVGRDLIQITGTTGLVLKRELRLIEAQPWQQLWSGDIPLAQSTTSGSLLTPAATIVLDGDFFPRQFRVLMDRATASRRVGR
jgi:hypothetical protein